MCIRDSHEAERRARAEEHERAEREIRTAREHADREAEVAWRQALDQRLTGISEQNSLLLRQIEEERTARSDLESRLRETERAETVEPWHEPEEPETEVLPLEIPEVSPETSSEPESPGPSGAAEHEPRSRRTREHLRLPWGSQSS